MVPMEVAGVGIGTAEEVQSEDGIQTPWLQDWRHILSFNSLMSLIVKFHRSNPLLSLLPRTPWFDVFEYEPATNGLR